MKNEIYGKVIVLNAEIESINPGEKATKMTVSYDYWDKDEKENKRGKDEIVFCNNDSSKLADVAAKLSIGDIINVLCNEKDGTLFGNKIVFSKGIFKISGEDDKVANVILGYVSSEPYEQENRLKISIPVGKDERTRWYNITFWDEKAENAKKCLKKGSHVAVICGKEKPYTDKNGKEHTQMTGYRFEFLKHIKTSSDKMQEELNNMNDPF